MKPSVPLVLAGFLIVAGLALATGRADAQESAAHPAFVYGINAAVPGSYVGTFAPQDDAIALLADQVSVLSPRMTEIYPWPITNEYRANWHALNDPLPGTLEVLHNNTVVATLASTDYTIQFTPRGEASTATLFLGQEAIAADADFRARQQAFQASAAAYQEAERAWLDAAAQANLAQQAGKTVSIPPAPAPPAPIGVFSNGLNQGIPIDLDRGEYRLRLRGPDGAIVAGSERALTIFAPRRTAVGYTVVPESRWTTPLESPAPGDVIYAAERTTIYLEPHLAREYPAGAWARLQNPQRPAAGAGEWTWVNGERIADGVLEVVQEGRVVDRRLLTPYQVTQIPGSQLGYQVNPLTNDAGDVKPDFTAYPIQAQGEDSQVRLISARGELMAGSERQVRSARIIPLNRLLLLPLAPLAAGMLVGARRTRRARAATDRAVTG